MPCLGVEGVGGNFFLGKPCLLVWGDEDEGMQHEKKTVAFLP